jgi:hypothetical protein
MSYTAILPLSYLNDACFLSLNTDDKKYNMVLKLAQQDLRDILKPEFYDEIVSQYPSSFTTDNQTLYNDYIKDYLAWLTYFKYLKFANLDATPTGIREFSDENSTVASDIKMYSLEKNVLATADNYKYSMINFLKESQSNDDTKYPLWEDDCKEYMSFAITSVDKNSDALIRVNKSIITNE